MVHLLPGTEKSAMESGFASEGSRLMAELQFHKDLPVIQQGC